jgi:tRNA/tmRNA/rRNA uracil-C5-methylase (TrmA/RlmC/RlmD family)
LSEASAHIVTALVADLTATWPELDAEVDWAENTSGTERVAHVTTDARVHEIARVGRVDGLDGLSWSRAREGSPVLTRGVVRVTDTLVVPGGASGVTVRHQARSFFQGNRSLLQPLYSDVLSRISGRTVCDLYAGVGLFAIGAASLGCVVEAVEGDLAASDDLRLNAADHELVACHESAVETFLARWSAPAVDTLIVDPPRTGLSADAVAGVLEMEPRRIVYVSCDPATLARDARRLVNGGYQLDDLRGFDLFPRTGHVEAVVTFDRSVRA